jgi:hypothetical protein
VVTDQFLLVLLVQDQVVVEVVDVVATEDQALEQVEVELVYLVKVQVAMVVLTLIKPAKVVQVVLMRLVVEETMEEDKQAVKVILQQAEPFVLYGDSTVRSRQLTQVICKKQSLQKGSRSLFCYLFFC